MANSVTRVSAQKDGNLCVASVQTSTAKYGADILSDNVEQPAAPIVAGTPSWVPLAIFLGSAGAAGILIATDSKGKDPVSQ